jgi:hypothetical protein
MVETKAHAEAVHSLKSRAEIRKKGLNCRNKDRDAQDREATLQRRANQHQNALLLILEPRLQAMPTHPSSVSATDRASAKPRTRRANRRRGWAVRESPGASLPSSAASASKKSSVEAVQVGSSVAIGSQA